MITPIRHTAIFFFQPDVVVSPSVSFKLSRSKQEHDELFVGEVMIERGGCFRSSVKLTRWMAAIQYKSR